jgi:hypothetical protein
VNLIFAPVRWVSRKGAKHRKARQDASRRVTGRTFIQPSIIKSHLALHSAIKFGTRFALLLVAADKPFEIA